MFAVGNPILPPNFFPFTTVPVIGKEYPKYLFAVFSSPLTNAFLILVELTETSSISCAGISSTLKSNN